MRETFESELMGLINKYSKENQSDTPDFILALYVSQALEVFAKTVRMRDNWYGFKTLSQRMTEDVQ